jgi:hypothetical protein
MLIYLHSCLNLTHTNYLAVTRGVFNFLYKDIADHIVFVIHVLKLLNTLCRRFFL